MGDLTRHIAALKGEFDRLRAEKPGGLRNLDHSHDLELTFTSNAIEGNTLTAAETTLVVEKGLTVAGKPLRDHLEAVDHFEAIHYVRALSRQSAPITERDVRDLHRLVVLRSYPDIAGRYADQGRYVLTETGRHAFPSPAEVPALMGAFADWLDGAADDPATAFAAHRRLGNIHPFTDGNGRTARLVMNLVLMRGGYPAVAIRPLDRVAYIQALQESRAGRGSEAFERLLYERLLATLDESVRALRDALPPSARPDATS